MFNNRVTKIQSLLHGGGEGRYVWVWGRTETFSFVPLAQSVSDIWPIITHKQENTWCVWTVKNAHGMEDGRRKTKYKNKNDFTNMPRPALKNTGGQTATNSFLFWLDFFPPHIEAVIGANKENHVPNRDRLGFSVLSGQSHDNVSQLLSGMNEMAFLLSEGQRRRYTDILYMDMKWTRDKILLLLQVVKHQHLLTEAVRFESEKHLHHWTVNFITLCFLLKTDKFPTKIS